MIVDLERNDLSRVCEPGSVRWPELMAERELAGVTHLVSTVEGNAAGGRRARGCSQPPSPAARHRRAEDRGAGRDRSARACRGASMGALGTSAGNGDLESRSDDPHVRGRGGASTSGSVAGSSGTRPRGGDRGIVDEGAAAPRRGRRPARGHRTVSLLAVAVSGRGVVDPDEPVSAGRRRGAAPGPGRLRDRSRLRRPAVPARRASRAPRRLGGADRPPGREPARARGARTPGARRGGGLDSVLRLYWTPAPRALALVSPLPDHLDACGNGASG